MSVRSARCALAIGMAAALAGPALAATPAQNSRFAKQLATYIKPTFAKQAPGLVLGTVTCVLPSNGTVVHCRAHFTDAKDRANVVYGIRATLQENGALKWTTTTHTCTDAKTGRKLTC